MRSEFSLKKLISPLEQKVNTQGRHDQGWNKKLNLLSTTALPQPSSARHLDCVLVEVAVPYRLIGLGYGVGVRGFCCVGLPRFVGFDA